VRVNHTLGRFVWTIIDFALKFKLQVEGLDPHKNFSFLPKFEKVVIVFNKR
jgi:hypothetical protein